MWNFPFVFLRAESENRKSNCERGCLGKSIPKKSSLSGWRGVPSHKRTRVHNNFKTEHLLLEWKVGGSDLSWIRSRSKNVSSWILLTYVISGADGFNDCSDHPPAHTKVHWKMITKGELINFMGVMVLITWTRFRGQRKDLWKTTSKHKYIKVYDFGHMTLVQQGCHIIYMMICVCVCAGVTNNPQG